MSHGVGMHAPMVMRGGGLVELGVAEPVISTRVPVLMGWSAAMREVVLRLVAEAEYMALAVWRE